MVGDLVGARIAIARWARLQHVGDEDVLAREAGLGEQLVEELAGAPDEGPSLAVLVRSGRLADDHDVRRRAALAGHEIGRLIADVEAARRVRADLGGDRVEQLLGVIVRHAACATRYSRL
jgi:hypothetical protein